MYRPAAFDVADADDLHALIRASGPAHLVTSTPDGLRASVLPMVLHPEIGEHGSLHGHLARPNGQWRDTIPGTPALAIFSGPDAYISPSWYATKAATGKVVPTWNYVTVNVHGELVVHDDPAWVEALVRELTDLHEGRRDDPWSVDDAPGDFLASMLKGIVGVELRITRIEGKRKLSQNRSAEDVAGVIDGLSAGRPDQQALADEMRRHVPSDR